MDRLAGMYLTMSPLIAGGIANMVFTKTKFYKKHKTPIDGGRNYKDGRRILGDNKTWIGFISMIVFCVFFQCICGIICQQLKIERFNDLYLANANTLTFNLLFGLIIGFVYMLSELPNSFIKRRLDIRPGKTKNGLLGFVFFIVDQIDSLLGVMFALYLFSDISLMKYFAYVVIGGITHIVVNLLLYLTKVRKNI